MTDPGAVLAVDIGGTLTKVAWARSDGGLDPISATAADATAADATSVVSRVPTERDGDAVSVPWLADLIANAAGGRADVRGFGVVAPGIVDAELGAVRMASNLGWRDLPLRTLLEQGTGLAGAVGHDVRTAGLAEWRLHHPARRDLLFVALGTGIAGAAVVDGRMLEARGYAGEIGHLAVSQAGDAPCACGHRGCLELVASAVGIAREYVRGGGDPGLDARQVGERARTGDRLAQDCFDGAGAALAEALGRYLTLLGPELIVLGGGLSAAADLLIPSISTRVRAGLAFEREPEIVAAGLGADAGVIGAGVLGWDRVGRPAEQRRVG